MLMMMMMVHAGVVSQKDRYDDEREAMCEVCNKPLRTTPQTPSKTCARCGISCAWACTRSWTTTRNFWRKLRRVKLLFGLKHWGVKSVCVMQSVRVHGGGASFAPHLQPIPSHPLPPQPSPSRIITHISLSSPHPFPLPRRSSPISSPFPPSPPRRSSRIASRSRRTSLPLGCRSSGRCDNK